MIIELKKRGIKDIFVACIDGLKGFQEIGTIFPGTHVQLCIAHMVRHRLSYVSQKQRKEVATDLKVLYTTNTIEALIMSLRKGTKSRGSFPNDKLMIMRMDLGTAEYRHDMANADPQLAIGIESVFDHV